jgi:hypothetical protein
MPGDSHRSLASILTFVLVLWFLVVLAAGAAGAFESGPTRPPLAVLVAVAAPLLAFAAAYRGSRRFRDAVLSVDLGLIAAFQSWRVIGLTFLFFYAFDLLPGAFAWPAGVGDAAVGFAAPFVVMAIVRRRPTWRRQALLLNVAGLVDFVVAIGAGVLTSNNAIGVLSGAGARVSLGSLPLSLIPTFAVPLWTIFHIVSLIQLARSAPAVSFSESAAASASI